MKLIEAPVNPNSPKPDIANLQDALLLLLDKHVLRGNPEDVDALQHERQAQAYADATQKFVREFRAQEHLEGDPSVVDAGTADGLNALLREPGAFDCRAGAPNFRRRRPGQTRRWAGTSGHPGSNEETVTLTNSHVDGEERPHGT
jgi:hypothetical protein